MDPWRQASQPSRNKYVMEQRLLLNQNATHPVFWFPSSIRQQTLFERSVKYVYES